MALGLVRQLEATVSNVQVPTRRREDDGAGLEACLVGGENDTVRRLSVEPRRERRGETGCHVQNDQDRNRRRRW
jgi:hypothetical protein